MLSKHLLNEYPRTKQFLEKTGFTLDQTLEFTESELKKQEIKKMGGGNGEKIFNKFY